MKNSQPLSSLLRKPGLSLSLGRLGVAQIWSVRPATILLIAALLLGTLAALAEGLAAPARAASESETVLQCNDLDVDNVAGRSVDCSATVTNSINLTTGTSRSTVVSTTCIGLVTDPAARECSTTSTDYSNAILSVIQCDSSGGGGDGQVTCSATITNEFVGAFTVTDATVNQCNGLDPEASPDVVQCDPPGIPGAANVSQCNYSGVGGGGPDLVRCTVTPSTSAAELPVAIDQCQSSGNGGRGTVICTATIKNIAAAVEVGAGSGAGNGTGSDGSLPGTGTEATLFVIGGLSIALIGVLLAAVARRGTRPRSGARAEDDQVRR
jgi:hypothetical protein